MPFKRQLVLFLLACVAALAVVSPWLIANLTRFDEPVLFSTNDGLTICGANLHRTYYGEGTGLWALDCAGVPGAQGRPFGRVERAAHATACTSSATTSVALPVVVAVRVGARVEPLRAGADGELQRERGPRRRGVVGRVLRVLGPRAVSRWSAGCSCVVAACRSRRSSSQFVIVTVTAAAIYGIARFRVPAEVSLVVLAAVAVDGWWGSHVAGAASTATRSRSRPRPSIAGP